MFGHQDNDQDSNQAFDEQPTLAPSSTDDMQQNPDSSSTPVVSASPQADMNDDSVTPPVAGDSASSVSSSGGNDDLLNIKQQALTQLSPLVGHLDQDPLEKFRTLMMMIQASDNQSLIKEAYDVASKIGDDKQKAQALLDIVNEINYFTHPQTNN